MIATKTRKKEKDHTTIAINGDMIEIIKFIKASVPRYECLEFSAVARQLIMEGMNRVYGDDHATDYIKAFAELKQSQKDRDKVLRRGHSTL